jgi:tetratricopeptide (TPR) repeat protein
MTFMLGICEQWVGDWGRVAEYAERVQEIVSELGDSRVAALPHFALGQRAVWMGDWETAQYHLDEVVRLTEEPVNLPLLKWAHRHLAEIELMHGRPADALARLLPLAGRPGLQSSATVLAPIAQARLEMGNTPAAQETIDQALAHARAEGDNVDLLMSLRVAAMVAIRETKWDDGEAAIEEGLHVAEMGPFDLGRGWMLQAWGSLLASAGDLDAARIKLQEALDIFDHLGAQGYREQTAEALAELAPDQGSEGGPYNSE